MTFFNDFTIRDNQLPLPAGPYEILVEEELLQGLSFEAYRRTATYLIVPGQGRNAAHTSMLMTTQEDLEHAIACDRAVSDPTSNSDAALSPLEDTT